MPEIIIPQRFAQRRDTEANWTAVNPVLWEGEIGFVQEEVTLKAIGWKVGDGVTPWNTLPYFSAAGGSGFIDMRVDSGYIQFQTVEDGPWTNLIAIADLQGEPGNDSTVPGPPGPAIELNVSATHIQYRTVGDEDWIDLIAIADLQGADGDSAYQIALANGFVGTEVEWLLSLQSTVPGPAGGPTEVLNTSGNITLDAATHKGKMLLHNTGVVTLPPTAAAGFAVNDIVEVRRQTSGAVSFATEGAASMDYNTTLFSPVIMNAKDVVGLKVTAVNTWSLFGPLADV